MMTNNQDARPFVELKKDAEEFRVKFDEDIQECINFLDSKITALICDPDSLGNPVRNIQQNALIEFSKEKYNIFISVKSLIQAKENEWLDYISEMKKLFIENVEIFLAGTKLEVKLPSSEFQPSPGPRKSPGNRKYSSSVTSMIYPVINSITKNIPVGDNVQSNRCSRISIKMNQPPKSITPFYQKDSLDTSSSENEASSGEKIKDVEMDTDESEIELNKSQSSVRSNSRSRSSPKLKSPGIIEKNVPVQKKSTTVSRSARGRRGKQAVQSTKLDDELQQKNAASQEREESSASDQRMPEKIVPGVQKKSTTVSRSARGRRGIQAVQNTKLDDAKPQESHSSSEENEDVRKVESTVNQVKGRRGRQGAKNRVNDCTVLAVESKTVVDTNSAKEKEPTVETVSPKVLRGRARVLNAEDSISDINIPIARPAKASTRRKTLLPNMEDTSGSEIIPGNSTSARSKRKTIGGDLELSSAKPSKRLKVGLQKNIPSVPEEDNEAADNLLESDDNYSGWMALKSVDGKIPTRPSIYEVKVSHAKKPAYIGNCESLRQQMTLYKLKQNSGHKHLDKFVARNYDNIQIRYEVVPSIDVAKGEVKNRIKSFVSQYKSTPAYN